MHFYFFVILFSSCSCWASVVHSLFASVFPSSIFSYSLICQFHSVAFSHMFFFCLFFFRIWCFCILWIIIFVSSVWIPWFYKLIFPNAQEKTNFASSTRSIIPTMAPLQTATSSMSRIKEADKNIKTKTTTQNHKKKNAYPKRSVAQTPDRPFKGLLC